LPAWVWRCETPKHLRLQPQEKITVGLRSLGTDSPAALAGLRERRDDSSKVPHAASQAGMAFGAAPAASTLPASLYVTGWT